MFLKRADRSLIWIPNDGQQTIDLKIPADVEVHFNLKVIQVWR